MDYVRVFLYQNEKEGTNLITRNMGSRACALQHDQTAIHEFKLGVVIKLQVM